MTIFCIQVEPDRAPGMDIARVRALAEDIASNKRLVKEFSIVEGQDEGLYINLIFETMEPQTLWLLLQDMLYQNEEVGPAMARASMAVCEGKDGWNDYLLLYHFDKTLKLDNLRTDNTPRDS